MARITIKLFIGFLFTIFMTTHGMAMSKKTIPQPDLPVITTAKSTAEEDGFPKEDYLIQKIKESGLDTVDLPIELSPDCNNADKTKVWTELLTGLAYVESGWNPNQNTPNDHNGTPSTGLYQMTGIDVYYTTVADKKKLTNSVKCFDKHSETHNEEKNINCAVWKMKELMNDGNSLQKNASRYWGPFTTKQYKKPGKGEALVSFVKRACRDQELNKETSSFIDSTSTNINNNIDYWQQIEKFTSYKSQPRSNKTTTKKSKGGR